MDDLLKRDAFISDLFEREYEILIRIAYRLTGDLDNAQDLVQDTFILAVSHCDDLIFHPSTGGWLTRTLYNLILNERRRLKTVREIPLDEMPNISAPEPTTSLDNILPKQLPQEDRKIIIWRFEQQMDYEEMSTRLGISVGACRMRISRALEKYRKYLRTHEP